MPLLSSWTQDPSSPAASYLAHVDELVQLLHDLLQNELRASDNNSEQRLVLVQAHSQRLNVVAPPSNYARNSIYHSALIPHKHRYSMAPHPAPDTEQSKTEASDPLSKASFILDIRPIHSFKIPSLDQDSIDGLDKA